MSKGLLTRKSQAAAATRGGWFSKLLGSSPNQPFLLDDELQALAELSVAPDSLVLQHDAVQPAPAAAALVAYKASVEFESFSVKFLDSGCPSFSAAISKFSAGIRFSDNTLETCCTLHRFRVSQTESGDRGQSIAASSLGDADAADQLVVRAVVSPESTSISGRVSGVDIVINAETLALLARWLDTARVVSTHSRHEAHAHGDADSSSVSLKLVALHIQRSPQIEVDFSWHAPTIRLQLPSTTLCLFLGHFTLTSAPADADVAALEVEPPGLSSADPHFSSGAYPCPSAIYHRFQLSLIDFTLGLADSHAIPSQSHDSFNRIIAPTSAELSFAFVRGEFMEQNWPIAQATAHCNSVSLEICPRYCSAFNDAILMFIQLLSNPEAPNSETIGKDVLLSISSYSDVDGDATAPSHASAPSPVLLLFVSNVPTATVRILGHDAKRSDCSCIFASSKTSLVIRPADIEAYMSVMQVTCHNNLLPPNHRSHAILSVNVSAVEVGSLLHFWYAEKGSALWSDTAAIGGRRITRRGPSLGLSLDCADAEFNVDLFCSQALLALISDNLDAFSAHVKDDLSRKMESLITEVKQQMGNSGSTFLFEGKFSRLTSVLFAGSDRASVLSAELSRSSVTLGFSEGSRIDFSLSSDAFKICDCFTSESGQPHAIIESDSSKSLQLSGVVSQESLTVAAALSKFQSNLFAPAVAKMWCLLFPPEAGSSEARSAAASTTGRIKVIDISLDFNGAEILFSDSFMSRSGFRLTAPTMQLSLDVQGDELTTIELHEGADAFQIDAVVGSLSMHVVSSDGSMRVALQPSRYDLHCPVKTLSLYVSDMLLDYALPFLSSVLGPAVSMLNPQQLVDKLIQQHAGKDFSISTGAEALHLFLGDSSAAQLFVPLFDVSARVSCLCSVLRFNVAPRSRLSTQHRKWMLSTKQ
jgi:hypothetical protein